MQQRPIKFRLWDYDEPQMIQWDDIAFGTSDVSDHHHLAEVIEGMRKMFVLMQFTGFTDAKGNEVYEYDIVYDPLNEHHHAVVFEYGGFYIDGSTLFDYTADDSYTLDGLEVVGNVFENLDLLSAYEQREFKDGKS